ncbi:MAG: hypothetical protein WA213_01220 [Terriglobales bacterium]
METMLQGLVIIGGLTFSLAAALLIEELIFGRIVGLAFAPRVPCSADTPVRVPADHKRSAQIKSIGATR